jgi:aspartate kinase
MKFGGTLMGSAAAIQRSAELVLRWAGQEAVVTVVSAMAGVTEALLKLGAQAEAGELEEVTAGWKALRFRHLEAGASLGTQAATLEQIDELLETLRQTLYGIYLLRELSGRSRDLLLSFGERLSAPLMAAALTKAGSRAVALTGGEAGLLTSDHFGHARPLPQTAERLSLQLLPLLAEGSIPVVTGFIGETSSGVITTLGRGGSDYTATLIGAALKADEVWTWKDVDGVMSADPRMVEGAVNLEYLSYGEVMELAHFGAKVLHPLAVTPLQESGIPLRVKSAADPDAAGTLVRAESGPSGPVKAVTSLRQACILTVSGAGMVDAPESLAQIFSLLAQRGISALMISQSSSMANLSLVLRAAEGQPALSLLSERFLRSEWVRDVQLREQVAVVAVVGEGMRGTQGVAAKLFGALAAEGINLLMIAQGSSELNISLAIEAKDEALAVRAAHQAFLSRPDHSSKKAAGSGRLSVSH